MVKNYVKRVPDKVEAVQFVGYNYKEIDEFLRSKCIFSELITENNKRKIVFFDNFEKTEINVNRYIVYDSARKTLTIMNENIFHETYAEINNNE